MIKKLSLFFILSLVPIMAATHFIPETLRTEQHQLEKAFQANPNSADTRFELAMNYAYTGWIQLGWDILKTIPKYDPHYEKTALPKYTALTQKDPNNWKHHFKLAFAYYFNDEKDKALNSFETVTKLNPKNPWGFGFMALIEGEKKQYDTVISLCNHALTLEPNATAIHFLQGEAYRQKGSYFKMLRKSVTVINLKAAEAKYRPNPFTDAIKE